MLTASFGLFLLTAVGISLSGVMAPGPLTAATITKGYRDKYAGTYIALGHAIVELPLMALIYFGFAHFLASPEVKKIVGLVGGLLLIFMGAMLFRTMNRALGEAGDLPSSSFITGIILTGANPYFFLWWATIGIALIYGAAAFGVYGLLIFVIVHWLCDLFWEQFISYTVFKTRHLWTPKVRKVVFGICALVLIGFGIWFGFSVFS